MVTRRCAYCGRFYNKTSDRKICDECTRQLKDVSAQEFKHHEEKINNLGTRHEEI